MTTSSTKKSATDQASTEGTAKKDGPRSLAIERSEVTPYQMTTRKYGVASKAETEEPFEETVAGRLRATPSAYLR